jgi:uncharacterized RDD family membrane protein YckC
MQFQNDPTDSQTPSAQCARHPESPAATICSRCGSYACSKCKRVGLDDRDYCFECVTRLEVLAGRGDRFVANLVDQFIIFLPWFGAVFLDIILSEGNVERGVPSGPISLLGLLLTLGVAVYQLILVSQSGQSIGKRWRKIRVVRTDGSPVSLGRILLLRNLVTIAIGSLCGLVNLIDALLIFNEDRRCLHDMIADTKVVEVSAENSAG